jgi:ABC-type sulfate/molybdate transport systems ATPase subunit
MADQLTCAYRKRFASGFTLDARLEIPQRAAVTVLFGPSGSGKSTLLRAIAGLERVDSESITFRGKDWAGLPPQRRRAGFLFQDYALFPHLTVAQNVGFASDQGVAQKAMERFGVADLSARRPQTLSGGQQQRVALARAVAAGPELLLLDEPLSALDARVRKQLRQWMRTLHDEVKVKTVLVTHDS